MIKNIVYNFANKFLSKNNDTYFVNSILRKYKSKSYYLTLYLNSDENKKEYTNINIYDTNNLKFGITYREAKKKIAYKDSVVKKDLVNSLVLIKKTTVGDYPTKLVLHFYKNSLFLFNYTFSNLDKNDKNSIKKILKEKYLNKNTQFDFSSQTILDHAGNYIVIEDDVYFTINYLSSKHQFFKLLNEEEIELNKKVKQNSELKKIELRNKL
ncbi:MAG: hypothetical protein ABJH82_07020 [Polaribacter sp.]|uniref:hypothetical protein n=1 Tax=Polaribacter sp. TaxID=1920175 RepID=UPI003263363C